MPLKRTLTVECDAVDKKPSHADPALVAARPCNARLELNPNTAQPWLDVVGQGWVVDHLGDLTVTGDIPTYCPQHAAGRL